MKKMFLASVMAVVAALFVGCGDVTSNESGAGNADGKAYLAVSVDVDTNVRSVAPQNVTLEDITKAELLYKKSGDTSAQAALLREWTSLQSVLAEKSLTIETGTYDFTLKLYKWTEPLDGTESQEVLTQTGTIANQVIKAGMNTLAFNTSYADGDGNLSIELTWTAEDRINKAEAGLFAVNANGSVGEELADFPVEELTIADGEYNATYTKSLPKGKYYLSFWFYQDSTMVKTWTDVVKIATGCNTTKETALSHINTMYSITYDVGEGAWVGDAESTLITTRNANTGVHLPESSAIRHATNATKVLGGWYVLDDEDNPLLDEKGDPIELTDIGTGDDTAKDYKLRANFVYSATGNVSADNRALAISVSTTELRLNSTVTFSVKEADGSPVTDTVHYTAKLLYKGKDVNTLADAADGGYYSLSENALSLVRKLPVTGDYQLYVTASRLISAASGNSVISSKTFDVTLEDGYTTPETQVALYQKDGNPYYYYLTDYAKVGTASLGTEDFMIWNNSISFDSFGKVYYLDNSNKVHSTNTKIESDGLDLSSELSYDSNGFAIDMPKNTAYGYSKNEMSLYLYKYPDLIESGSKDNYVTVQNGTEPSFNVSDFYADTIAVNDDILYVVGSASDNGEMKAYMVVYNLSSGAGVELASVDVQAYITGTMGLSSSATVTDAFAMEGAVYLLVSDKANGISNGRGSVIKYVPPAAAGETGSFSHIDMKTDSAISNTSIPFMVLYETNFDKSPVYADENGASYLKIMGAYGATSGANPGTGDTLCNAYFPTVYSVSASEKYLTSPAKVIAVKPKKLVIADDGYAFYTDKTTGELFYKNMNRVVTIDLKDFIVESMQTTPAKFDSDASGFLRTATTLDNVRSGGTYYDYNASAWCLGSDNAYHSYSLSDGSVYLTIREGNN